MCTPLSADIADKSVWIGHHQQQKQHHRHHYHQHWWYRRKNKQNYPNADLHLCTYGWMCVCVCNFCVWIFVRPEACGCQVHKCSTTRFHTLRYAHIDEIGRANATTREQVRCGVFVCCQQRLFVFVCNAEEPLAEISCWSVIVCVCVCTVRMFGWRSAVYQQVDIIAQITYRRIGVNIPQHFSTTMRTRIVHTHIQLNNCRHVVTEERACACSHSSGVRAINVPHVPRIFSVASVVRANTETVQFCLHFVRWLFSRRLFWMTDSK